MNENKILEGNEQLLFISNEEESKIYTLEDVDE